MDLPFIASLCCDRNFYLKGRAKPDFLYDNKTQGSIFLVIPGLCWSNSTELNAITVE